MTTEIDDEARSVISKLGGPAVTARLCRVTTGAVSQWLRNGIPPARRMFIELARPDVFAKERRVNRAPP